MHLKYGIIWIIAGIGLYLLGSGLSGFAVYEHTCCLPSPFCEEVATCDFSKEINDREEIIRNFEFIILGLMMIILLFILYENSSFFKE